MLDALARCPKLEPSQKKNLSLWYNRLKEQFFYTAIVVLIFSVAANVYLYFLLRNRYYNEKIRAVFPVTHHQEIDNDDRNKKLHVEKKIVLLGDSRIAQWKNLPKVDGVEFIRRGISCETTAQLRLRITQELKVIAPDYVVLQIGINDLVAAGIAPALELKIVRQLKANYIYLLEECRKKDIGIYLLTIIPPDTPPLYRLPFWSSRIQHLVDNTNQWILSHIRTKYNIIILDSKNIFSSELKGDGSIYKDTLHLNKYGYKMLNKAIENIFK